MTEPDKTRLEPGDPSPGGSGPGDPGEPRASESGGPRLPVSRRGFLKGTGLTVASVGLFGATGLDAQTATDSDVARVVGPDNVALKLDVNGAKHSVSTPPSATLLDVCRDKLDLTGSKRVCDRGACGACSMMVDGELVNSCSYLAIDAVGKSVRTIEGVTPENGLSPLQESFVACDALQCGFCTPGMVVACTALLEKNPKPSRSEIARGIAGNACRCGTYQNIFEAVQRTSAKGGK